MHFTMIIEEYESVGFNPSQREIKVLIVKSPPHIKSKVKTQRDVWSRDISSCCLKKIALSV